MVYEAACRYFGLKTTFDIDSFLPEPAVRELNVDPNSGNEQDVLLGAVEKIYNIKADDLRMRGILERPKEKKGEFFDSLRKNYPLRREFHNTQVVLESACEVIAERLGGIGFKLTEREKG